MRKDYLLVVTRGTRQSAKEHSNTQGYARLSVSKGYNEPTDTIEVEVIDRVKRKESALINITFNDGTIWSGGFDKLKSLVFQDLHEIGYISSIVGNNLFDKIYETTKEGSARTSDLISTWAIEFEEQYKHVEEWEEFLDNPANNPFDSNGWEDFVIDWTTERLRTYSLTRK